MTILQWEEAKVGAMAEAEVVVEVVVKEAIKTTNQKHCVRGLLKIPEDVQIKIVHGCIRAAINLLRRNQLTPLIQQTLIQPWLLVKNPVNMETIVISIRKVHAHSSIKKGLATSLNKVDVLR